MTAAEVPSQPWLHHQGRELQAYGTVRDFPIARSNDVRVGAVIRTGELQAWFLAEHLVETPLVGAAAP